jgi:ADP-heptose:LPS heptosyltransferase
LRTVKILILKPSSLGDVVQAMPVLRLLKLHWPDSEIYWWINSRLAPLLEGDPDLTDVVRFNRRGWAAPAHWGELWRSLCWSRNQSFDLVIDLQSLARSGAFAWLADGKLLVGLDDSREGARGFYDLVVPRAHGVERADPLELCMAAGTARRGRRNQAQMADGFRALDRAAARRPLDEQALARRKLRRAGASSRPGLSGL